MRYLIVLLSFTLSVGLMAQESPKSNADFFKLLAIADTLTGAKVNVLQDEAVANSLSNRNITVRTVKSGTGAGFRIQVFSSNVQRTAKSEAFKIEKEIRTAFPELGVYVSYTSPFWKVRVGDFKTSQEAQDFSSELIAAFPSLRNATYTVKDKINF